MSIHSHPHPKARPLLALGLALIVAVAACQPGATVEPPTPSPEAVTVVITATAAEQSIPTPTPELPAEESAAGRYPTPSQVSMEAVDEYFERGYIVWLSDWGTIWVFVQPLLAPGDMELTTELERESLAPEGSPALLASGGPWYAFDDTFVPAADLQGDPNLTAPAGMHRPKGGIGKIWRENPALRAALGWALDWEQPYWTLINTYAIGVFGEDESFVPTDRIHTIYSSNGDLFYVHEAAGIWSRP